MGLRAIPDRALARLSMAGLGILLLVNGAVLLQDGGGRHTTRFVVHGVDGGPHCQPTDDPDAVHCSGVPVRAYGEDKVVYDGQGVALQAGGLAMLSLGAFLSVYQLVRWAPERAGPSFMPPEERGAANGPAPAPPSPPQP